MKEKIKRLLWMFSDDDRFAPNFLKIIEDEVNHEENYANYEHADATVAQAEDQILYHELVELISSIRKDIDKYDDDLKNVFIPF